MGTSREITTRQVATAKEALQRRVSALTAAGVEKLKFNRDPKWRELDAQVRQLNARLRQIGKVETVTAELEQRRVQHAAEKAAEKAAPKQPAAKAAKAPAKAKKADKGEAKPKKEKAAK